jgi:hypothetical protein
MLIFFKMMRINTPCAQNYTIVIRHVVTVKNFTLNKMLENQPFGLIVISDLIFAT